MSEQSAAKDEGQTRRGMLARASTWAMGLGLVGGYGALASIAARFLYPPGPDERRWMFVVETARVSVGDSLLYRGPSGETINITRRSRDGGAEDFIALSSTCPHLGCQVHWEGHNDRYFCPCHNGVFDAAGKGTAGPPGEAGLSLPNYPLDVRNELLYVQVPISSLQASDARGEVIERVEGIHAAGHDPCLVARGSGGNPAGRA